MGDNGQMLFNAASELTSVLTSDQMYGGNDTIRVSGGPDIVLGGSGSDSITGGLDGSPIIVLGDNGSATFVSGVLMQVSTKTYVTDLADTITSGAGNDVIVGGRRRQHHCGRWQ